MNLQIASDKEFPLSMWPNWKQNLGKKASLKNILVIKSLGN